MSYSGDGSWVEFGLQVPSSSVAILALLLSNYYRTPDLMRFVKGVIDLFSHRRRTQNPNQCVPLIAGAEIVWTPRRQEVWQVQGIFWILC